jgi:hypothetical protein
MASLWPTMLSWCCSTVSCGREALAERSCACFLERGIHDHLEIERQLVLRDEIERAEFHRLDDRLRGAELADEKHARIRIAFPHAREQFHAAKRLELRIGDDEVRAFALREAESVVG